MTLNLIFVYFETQIEVLQNDQNFAAKRACCCKRLASCLFQWSYNNEDGVYMYWYHVQLFMD